MGSGCKAQHPSEVGREAARLVGTVARPAGGVVFAGGSLATQLEGVATAVAVACPGLPFLVATGAWVASQAGELEDQSAAAILVWSGKAATLTIADGDDPPHIGERLARELVASGAATSTGAVLLALDPERFEPALLDPLHALPRAAHVIGFGTTGSPGAIAVSMDGTLRRGPAIALGFRGLTAPVIEVSPAARLLTPLRPISASRGSLVLRLGEERALDALTTAGEGLEGEPLLLAALADGIEDTARARPEFFVRPIRGVDPTRRGVFVSDEARAGVKMAIAARDPVAAREDIEAATRRARRTAAGAAPRFGLYLTCTGRGSRLYGSYDVDGRLLRTAFNDMPLVGVSGAFQIAPHAGRPRLHLFSGVLALFTAPS
ncbi:MAG: FIST C-terminal domain-containing protein [Polyangiaceae bacterium]|nr:FIST C-terminal domain-containing protein [Polyangiaceae bacterium]